MGRTAYADVHALQRELLEKRVAGEVGDQLILTEHDPIITLGRGAKPADVEGVDVPIVEVERGGEATYHGPGQLVAYPILRLGEGRRDLHRYMRDLEEIVIRALAEVQIEGRRDPGLTGVWIGEKKVCSIGVAARGWVTWHGLALNVHTELGAFQSFRPCGLDPERMTSVAEHAEIPPTNLLFEVLVVKHLCEVFELELPPPPPPPAEPPQGSCSAGGGDLPIFPGQG